jgi:CDP-diacylglycerol---serine O-phosphatidyltransferase
MKRPEFPARGGSEDRRERRRRRIRRRGRRAYIRSVYFLPSLATLGNAVCGFASIYVAGFDAQNVGSDPVALFLLNHKFVAAAYLVFFAMIFDALDGRLARFARHTTDFGGQLDSLADVISFGAAPAFLALQVFKADGPKDIPFMVTRLVWAIGALYFSCALLRLARFNVSNEHGEQHHFSFLGLPSPGAGGAVVAFVLMQQDFFNAADPDGQGVFGILARVSAWILPLLVLSTGLLMVSSVRYPHFVNRYLRGRRSFDRLLLVVAILLLLVVAHRYTIAGCMLLYAYSGFFSWAYLRLRLRAGTPVKPGV